MYGSDCVSAVATRSLLNDRLEVKAGELEKEGVTDAAAAVRL